ncbi:MAG TPA: hypothetical protein DHW42_04405 [Candidatus Marinimicrobia bacterium]|nr:hypothetical protein [Candidatus Neomarinimicrobiota bacterium]
MIRKFIIFLIVIFSASLLAEIQQADYIHQYIVREAWKLAKYQCPALESTDLAEHIGNNETGNYPWETGLVVSGAYREDHEDPVYGYGGFDLFGIIDPVFVTMTHFWNADLGDDFKWNFLGSHWENHYQRAQAYLYGNHSIFIFKKSWAADYQQVILGRFIKYVDLFHLYNTGKLYNNGYIDLAGNIHYWESSELTTINIATSQKYAYEILGRLCHLLGDAGTPAHAHNDDHPFGDSYENYMKDNYSNWNYEDALNAGGVFFDIFKFNCPLRFLLYTTNQVADHFPSDDRSGDNTVTYSYNGDYYEELNGIINNLGASPSSVNPSDIAEAAFVYSIRATATLLYWFAVETGQITLPPLPLSINISGPTSQPPHQPNNFTANPSGGSGTYTNYQWWYRNDGGTVPREKSDSGAKLPPVNTWIYLADREGQKVISFGPSYNFSLKCRVYDSKGNVAEDIHSVIVGGLAKDIAKPISVAELEIIPKHLTLSGNYPNPFNPITTIRFGLPESQKVDLSIYDLGGNKVKTLLRDVVPAGYHQVQWDGKDNSGNKVPSGIYIYQMSSDNINLVKKMILTK